MRSLVRQGAGIVLLAFAVFLTSNYSQSQDFANKRRITIRSSPVYPDLARAMALQGVVKVEAVVSSDGTVKEVAIKGGHPVLAQAAANTVRHWKWEPSGHESHEVVEVKFSPPED